MKKYVIAALIGLSSFGLMAEETNKTSFIERFSVSPYYSLRSEGNLNFDDAGAGVEMTFHVNKYIGISLNAEGWNDLRGKTVDHLGAGLTTTLPLGNSKFALYAQGGFGYNTENEDTDMIIRGGVKFQLFDRFGLFGDIGQGVVLQDGNTYQQIRTGINISF